MGTKGMIYAVLISILCLMVQDLAQAESPVIPDTPAGKKLATWLTALNNGDFKALRDFHAESDHAAQAEDMARQDVAMHRDSQRLELMKIEKSEPLAITALVRSQLTEEWLRMMLTVAAEPPHKVKQIGMNTTRNPEPGKKLTEAEMVQALDAYVSKLVKADVFSGSVIIAKDDKVLFKKAYGLASKAYNVKNNVETKFNLGSMNKMFTAVTIAQLVQEGKLSFTDPVGKILPDFPNKDVAQKVTIHHLLTHTSGLRDYFNEKFMETSRDKFRSVNDFLPLFQNEPLQFEPGSKWSYSNAGFMLLGAIIEKVTGQNYFDYVREHLYKPAGMTNTDAYELDRDTPNLATGYTRMGAESAGERKNNIFLHVLKGGPAGGGYSTVEDLHRFALALKQHKLLAPQTTETLISAKADLPFDPNAKYAYGFFDRKLNGKRIVGHGGGFPGLNSDLNIYLDSGYIVAVMSNYDPPAAQRVSNKVQEWLLAN